MAVVFSGMTLRKLFVNERERLVVVEARTFLFIENKNAQNHIQPAVQYQVAIPYGILSKKSKPKIRSGKPKANVQYFSVVIDKYCVTSAAVLMTRGASIIHVIH